MHAAILCITIVLVLSWPESGAQHVGERDQSLCKGIPGSACDANSDDEYTSMLQVSSSIDQARGHSAPASNPSQASGRIASASALSPAKGMAAMGATREALKTHKPVSALQEEVPALTDGSSLLETDHLIQSRSGTRSAEDSVFGAQAFIAGICLAVLFCVFCVALVWVSFFAWKQSSASACVTAHDEPFVVVVSGVCFSLVVIAVFLFCATAISPLEWGVLKGRFSGSISEAPVKGGLHWKCPFFQLYDTSLPATRMTILWAQPSFHRHDMPYVTHTDEVKTRTGRDPKDTESGGQPISISCAVQFQLIPEKLKSIYLNFGDYQTAEQRFVLLAGNAVSNTAQDFTPQDFWENRHKVSAKILDQINKTLTPQGAVAKSFQLLRVNFADSFEQSITNVQVAEQEKVVNEYSMQVQEVEQEINVKNSSNQGHIQTIQAMASRTYKENIANATKYAFILKQKKKSKVLSQIKQAFGFNDEQLDEYIKIKALMAQAIEGKEVINIEAPFSS